MAVPTPEAAPDAAPEPDLTPAHSGGPILLAMVLGVAWGCVARGYLGGATYVSAFGEIFKASLKMIIVPLVLGSIVTGITSLGDVRRLGRIGLRTLGYYALTTGLAVVLGLTLVRVIEPGGGGKGGAAMQVTLEVNQGRPARLERLAEAEGKAGRRESARALLDLYLARYGDRVPALESARVTAARDAIPPTPEFRRESRRREAAARWKAETGQDASPMTVKDFLRAQIGKVFKNPFAALAGGDVLAIIVFSLLLGACLTTLGPRGTPLIAAFDSLNAAMMVMTDWLMRTIAPVGVFALMAGVVAEMGWDVMQILAAYMGTVVAGLALHGFVVLPTLLRLRTGMGLFEFLRGARPALAVALSTSSSSATLPVSIEAAERGLGCDPRTAGFVLPLGATVNMDGTALYEAVAALFIAQIYGHDLGLGQQVLVALTATLAAVGAAGIPSAGTVTMVMVLNAANLPLEGIALILSVDRILDMCRTAINVLGDLAVAVIVDRAGRQDLQAADLGAGEDS